MAVVLPPPVAVMSAGLSAQTSVLIKDNYHIIPTVQVLLNNLAYVISVMEPEAARETVIQAAMRDLPGMVAALADERRKTKGGIIVPGHDDKRRVGG